VTGAVLPFPAGSITVESRDGGMVLRLEGEVDTATVAAFDAEHPGGNAFAGVWVVDASAVTFLNSVGVRLLVRATEPARAAGIRPVLWHPSRVVEQVLRLTGVDELFDVVPGP